MEYVYPEVTGLGYPLSLKHWHKFAIPQAQRFTTTKIEVSNGLDLRRVAIPQND
jgi:hypothetical protein